MSDKKKTAVDLLLDKITDYEMGETLLRLIGKDEIDHIRNVEREQLMEAYKEGDDNGFMATESYNVGENAEKYISETYGE